MQATTAPGGAHVRASRRTAQRGGVPLFETVRRAERILGTTPGALFDELSAEAHQETWADLRDRQDRLNRFLAYGDGAAECARRRLEPDSITSASSSAGRTPHRHHDPLLAVPLPAAFEVLLGQQVPRSRMVLCPVHEERTPSCKVDADLWYCHGCGAGGSLYDLGAHLYALSPRGESFFELRRLLARQLLVREEATA